MIPATVNFSSWVGDTVRVRLSLVDSDDVEVDITGCSVAAQARAAKKDATVLADFVCTITDSAGGVVDLLLPASKAQAIPEGKFPWDLQITWPPVGDAESVVETYAAGIWTTTMDVTRVNQTT